MELGVVLKLEVTKTALTCRHCGQKGTAVWEGAASNPKSVLVSLEGFYERLASKKPHAIELVCHQCGEVQQG